MKTLLIAFLGLLLGGSAWAGQGLSLTQFETEWDENVATVYRLWPDLKTDDWQREMTALKAAGKDEDPTCVLWAAELAAKKAGLKEVSLPGTRDLVNKALAVYHETPRLVEPNVDELLARLQALTTANAELTAQVEQYKAEAARAEDMASRWQAAAEKAKQDAATVSRAPVITYAAPSVINNNAALEYSRRQQEIAQQRAHEHRLAEQAAAQARAQAEQNRQAAQQAEAQSAHEKFIIDMDRQRLETKIDDLSRKLGR